MSVSLFDKRICTLGEGPLWHPLRQQLFWFDILACRLLSQRDGQRLSWDFERPVSAAGWVDESHLLIADSISLFQLNIDKGDSKVLTLLEDNNSLTRSNDGRADPWGGFWIGTMGRNAEHQAGSIYRYYQGELRKLHSGLTITNSICFDPQGRWVYFSDTAQSLVWKQTLDSEDGWPVHDPEIYLDLSKQQLNPDGAICDRSGNFWVALWGVSQVACFNEKAQLLTTISFPASHLTCPAWGGENLDNLFVTSATLDLSQEDADSQPQAGQTFLSRTDGIKGQAEPAVILS